MTIEELLKGAPDCEDCGKDWCSASCGRFAQLEEFHRNKKPELTLEQQARNLYDDIDKAYRFQDWDAHEVVVPMIVEALREARK